MAWDLATAYVYTGLVAGTADAALTLALDTVAATIERYLGRGVLKALDQSEIVAYQDGFFFVSRYPITNLKTVDGAVPSNPTVRQKSGIVELAITPAIPGELTVVYDGGYDPLPADLERAMWEIFLKHWSETDAVTGGPIAGAGTQVISGSGNVSSVTLQDLGTVRFDVGSTVVSASDSAAADAVALWGPLASWATALAPYRSDRGVGIGFF